MPRPRSARVKIETVGGHRPARAVWMVRASDGHRRVIGPCAWRQCLDALQPGETVIGDTARGEYFDPDFQYWADERQAFLLDILDHYYPADPATRLRPVPTVFHPQYNDYYLWTQRVESLARGDLFKLLALANDWHQYCHPELRAIPTPEL